MPLAIDMPSVLDFLLRLLRTPSPSGDTAAATTLLGDTLTSLGLKYVQDVKGGILVTLRGTQEDAPRALSAHVDTLGGMVKEIKTNGRLKMEQVGGYYWQSVEGENCSIVTTSGKRYSGTILPVKSSTHVHGREQNWDHSREDVEVRVDARVTTCDETRALGIEVGDFIYLDSRSELTESGFVKSRHLDDKAGVAAIIAALGAMVRDGVVPAQTTYIYFSVYEEVGHGTSAGFPAQVRELVAVDMGAMGEGQNGSEYAVSICAKDGGGPYTLALRRRLERLAREADIPYRTDIYIYYGSDTGPALRSGLQIAHGLIGPAVDASHAYERTHTEAIQATAQLIGEYLRTP